MSETTFTCHKRGCTNEAQFALHLDGEPHVFHPETTEDGQEIRGTQSEERITEQREFYCAEHAQEALEAKDDSSIITSGL